MEESKKCVKACIEYDNGEIYTLEGPQTQDWFKQINNILAIWQWTKGCKIEQFDWKITKKSKS